MYFLNQLSPERQNYLISMIRSQHPEIFCDELVEAFAERCYAIERDLFCQMMLERNGCLLVPVEFRDQTLMWVIDRTGKFGAHHV